MLIVTVVHGFALVLGPLVVGLLLVVVVRVLAASVTCDGSDVGSPRRKVGALQPGEHAAGVRGLHTEASGAIAYTL